MNWHYLDNGQQRGPVTEDQFSQLVQQGTIREDTFIWCHGMEKWQRYGELVPATAAAAADASAETGAGAEEAGGGLRVHHEEASPAETREGACSQCGAVVPVTHLMTVGSRQLCPQCQVGQRRLAATGWGRGAVEYANPFLRWGVFILDSIVCNLVVIVIGFVFGFIGQAFGENRGARAGFGLVMLLVLLWWVLHYFVGKIANDGATPVMKWAKIQVVSASGGAISWWRALGRYLVIGLVNMFTLGLGHLVALFDQQKRSLHDMVCGTIVIKS